RQSLADEESRLPAESHEGLGLADDDERAPEIAPRARDAGGLWARLLGKARYPVERFSADTTEDSPELNPPVMRLRISGRGAQQDYRPRVSPHVIRHRQDVVDERDRAPDKVIRWEDRDDRVGLPVCDPVRREENGGASASILGLEQHVRLRE